MQGVAHMNVGDGDNSYATNSSLQKTGVSIAMPVVKKAIAELYRRTSPQCLTIADMGCSSGPNALSVISELVNTVDILSRNSGGTLPEFQVFLNDLPENDFNTMFKSVCGNSFPRCFIAGVPGSFYGRLFPANTLRFVHSSYSLHWLSQVPKGIGSNKGNIYVAKTSPPAVFEAYKKQFDKDFSLFLRSRSEEIISGGRMAITIVGRIKNDPYSNENDPFLEILGDSLAEMVKQGYMEEAKLDSFNMPVYLASSTEVRNIIRSEGSFHLDSLEVFSVDWDPSVDSENKEFVLDKKLSGKRVAKTIRAITETILTSHFGTEIIDDLFQWYAERVAKQFVEEKMKYVILVVCMTKKDNAMPV